MILRGDRDETVREETPRPDGAGSATLDNFFRRAGVQAADSLALIDPPNRRDFTDHAPRRLTYAQADRAISALAAKLCRLGLQTDAVVAIQLPNNVESIITLLAVLRAGMIALPLPLLWRQHDLKAALSMAGAKAIITTSRVGTVGHARLAMEVAVDLFPIRFICAYGDDLPDGVVPLDDVFTTEQNSIVSRSMRTGQAADHIAIITFDVTPDGLVAVARSHGQLTAGASQVVVEASPRRNRNILSAIPASSFAGLAVSVLPWLLEGGALSLHHCFAPATFFTQCQDHAGGMIVLPGPALSAIGSAASFSGADTAVIALWRSPEQLATTASWRSECALVDVACFGEIGLVAARRGGDALPAEIPLGSMRGILETKRSRHGTLALRGAMVPEHAFPSAAANLIVGEDGFIDTGFTCKLDASSQSLTISGPPGGITAIGGYRFRPADLDAQVAAAESTAAILSLPGSVMAQQLAGHSLNPNAARAGLLQNGANPLLAGAFRPRGNASAAECR
jgi:AMP-binding enzyme